MRNILKRFVAVSAVASLAGAASVLAAIPATATPSADNVVINEVYVRGGNGDGVYRDYVELYNPTDHAISLDGWSIQYFSKAGTKGNGTTPLSGEIAAGGYYLVLGSESATHTTELSADATGGFNASGTDGTIILFAEDATQTITQGNKAGAEAPIVDVCGIGTAATFEGSAHLGSTKGAQAYHRTDGVDTDNNANDFTIAAPSPTSSAGAAENPGSTPGTGSDTPDTQELTIAQIQGVGAQSAYVGQTVTTKGFVTATYPTGGFNGLFIQAPGTGNKVPEGASEGLYVYGSKIASALKIGDYVEVTGKVSEYGEKDNPLGSLTELSADSWNVLDKTGVEGVTPLVLEALPEGAAAREVYEGMLVQLTGPYTVSNNYSTNTYGEFGVVAGTEPVRQPSDYIDYRDQEALAAATQAAADAVINVDDGASANLTTFTKDNDWIPAAYLDVNDPLLVGAQVTFLQPFVVDFRNDTWKLQPTEAINAKDNDGVAPYEDNWTKWIDIVDGTNVRQAAPGSFGGDITVSSFNVLNYFTDLGDADSAQSGCSGYADRDDDVVTARDCDVRGAWDANDLAKQQSKIVAAINQLDSSVVGLEEIENSVKFGHDRDESLNILVKALNAAAGMEKWKAVASPDAARLPELDNQDVIRLAFIYQPAEVQPVGDSKVMYESNKYFDGVARQPLAQQWQALDADGKELGDPFVVIVNHLKSKGSLSKVFPNDEDGYAGNNDQLRTQEVKELVSWAQKQYSADIPTFIIGDLNSYSKERPVVTLEEEYGYTNIAEMMGVQRHSYQYSGLVGSMDHALVNAAGKDLVVGADLWNVNAMEPLAFEYSRYNYNIKFEQLFDAASPYRSSDHDPIKFALKFTAHEPSGDQPEAHAPTTPDRLSKTGGVVVPLVVVAALLLIAGIGVAIAAHKRHE